MLILLFGAAFAQEAPPAFTPSGELRYLASLPADFVIDAEGDTVGQSFVLDQRLRLGGAYQAKKTLYTAEADLFTGQLLGDPWDITGAPDERYRGTMGVVNAHAFLPRKLNVQRLTGPVLVTAGLTTSQWGLGMLANDGASDPYFGRSDGGDVVLRAMGQTRPIKDQPLGVALAFDRVYADDVGSWWPGHQAIYQGILAAQWAPKDKAHAGAYVVYRHQREADKLRKTDITAVDLTFDAPLTAGPATLRFAGEGATILGATSRAASANSPEGLAVRQFGATGLGSAHFAEGKAGLILRGGYASGDGDGYDAYARDFTFDPNFDVGMVMFDEVQGALGAAAYGRLNDPGNMGQPPDGAELLVTEGAFKKSAFVQPILEAKPTEWSRVRVGALVGWATAPIGDPFYSGRNGGTPTNQLNEVTEGYDLGWELDWSLQLQQDVKVKDFGLQPALLLQGGHYFPSANVGTERVDLYTATARLRF